MKRRSNPRLLSKGFMTRLDESAAKALQKRYLLSWKATIILSFIVGLAGLGAIWGVMASLSSDLPRLEQLESYNPRLITRVLDRNGSVLKEFFTERRQPVPLDSISQHMIDAVISTEDRKFYDHWGIDAFGIARAVVVNTISMSKRQGASTLTQQLARNLYLHRRQTIRRKLREIITAVNIERTYAKQEILQMYMTQMYFGHGAYGVQAAAMRYFGVDARDLSIAQSALLAGMLKAPTHYSPVFHPADALRRRNTVLGAMLRNGVITQPQYEEARQETIQLSDVIYTDNIGQAPYFTEWIRRKLEELKEKHDVDYYRDGLTVYTPLDSTLQAIAEAVIDSHLTEFQAEFADRYRWEEDYKDWAKEAYTDSLNRHAPQLTATELADSVKKLVNRVIADSALAWEVIDRHFPVQVAFVAMDPQTGDILSMVGGRDFIESKFNRVIQSQRQPGSTFKPFVYTTAIDNGYPPNYKVLNMVKPVTMEDGTVWRPENYSVEDRGGYMTLRRALRLSKNNVTVRLVAGEDRLIPIREVTRYAHNMGIRTELPAYPAVALGAVGVIPIDLATAYCVFASYGMRPRPRPIWRIEDNTGGTLASYPTSRYTVLSEETAYIMVNLLEDVINRGTGAGARYRFKFYAPAAGKTGTTNDFTDAWFMGFTPRLVAGVWVGLDNPAISLGRGQTGSRVAMPVWARFMRNVYEEKGWEYTKFAKPVGVVKVEVCEDSNELAGPYCPNTYFEIFRRGEEPTYPCSIHRINRR